MEKRPNIIIVNPDQMRADSLAHLGNPASHTPFLDHLAESEAVSFSNAFCQNPVCVPSRCSFTTGLYPHVNGHRTMAHLLRPHETSIFEELKNAGYYVWMNARNDLIAGQVPGLERRSVHGFAVVQDHFRVMGDKDLLGAPFVQQLRGGVPVGEPR